MEFIHDHWIGNEIRRVQCINGDLKAQPEASSLGAAIDSDWLSTTGNGGRMISILLCLSPARNEIANFDEGSRAGYAYSTKR